MHRRPLGASSVRVIGPHPADPNLSWPRPRRPVRKSRGSRNPRPRAEHQLAAARGSTRPTVPRGTLRPASRGSLAAGPPTIDGRCLRRNTVDPARGRPGDPVNAHDSNRRTVAHPFPKAALKTRRRESAEGQTGSSMGIVFDRVLTRGPHEIPLRNLRVQAAACRIDEHRRQCRGARHHDGCDRLRGASRGGAYPGARAPDRSDCRILEPLGLARRVRPRAQPWRRAERASGARYVLSSQGTTCGHGGPRPRKRAAGCRGGEHRKPCREDRQHDALPADPEAQPWMPRRANDAQ